MYPLEWKDIYCKNHPRQIYAKSQQSPHTRKNIAPTATESIHTCKNLLKLQRHMLSLLKLSEHPLLPTCRRIYKNAT